MFTCVCVFVCVRVWIQVRVWLSKCVIVCFVRLDICVCANVCVSTCVRITERESESEKEHETHFYEYVCVKVARQINHKRMAS